MSGIVSRKNPNIRMSVTDSSPDGPATLDVLYGNTPLTRLAIRRDPLFDNRPLTPIAVGQSVLT